MSGEQYAVEWSVWTTTARVVVRRPESLLPARQAVEAVLADMDRAANRFDPSSEVSRLARLGAVRHPVSPLLARTLHEALRVARATCGCVDPTVGSAMVALGYDRAAGPADGPRLGVQVTATATWRDIGLDGDRLTLPAGVVLDLGATGKALAVDLAAERAAEAVEGSVLVAVGGDLRACGPPSGEPWTVEVAETPTGPANGWIQLNDGGLATSSTTTRTWLRGGYRVHHVLDPSNGHPATVHWRTATVAAATCVDANAASTAALVKGSSAVQWLRREKLPARLVHLDGSVIALGGWPTRDAA